MMRRHVFGLTVIIAATLAGACGGDSSSEGSANTVSTAGSDDALRAAVFSGMQGGFDPHGASGGADLTWLSLVYDALVGIGRDGELVPQLAESWERVDNGRALVITVREDVKFHDGSTLDAEAVAANLDRARAEDSQVAEPLRSVADVVVIDARTVRLELKEPDSVLLHTLAGRAGMMISPAAFDNDLGRNPVGAGRFQLTEHRRGDIGVFERWDDYWDPDAVPADRIELYPIDDERARLNALQSGEVDIAYRLTPDQIDVAREAGFTVEHRSGLLADLIIFNRATDELRDQRVRQALNHAIDRDAVSDLDSGYSEPTTQLYVEGSVGHSEAAADMYPYDPGLARDLLSDAGYADGFDLTLLVPLASTQPLAQVVQSQYGDIGIDVNLRQIDVSQTAEMMASGEADGIIGPATAPVDPVSYLRYFVTESPVINPSGHREPEWTDALERVLAARPDDFEQAAAEFHEAVTRGAVAVFVKSPPYAVAYNERVQGLELRNAYPDLRHLRLAG